MKSENDNPNVIAPPPLIFLSGLLVGGLITWFFPSEFLPKSLAVVLGIALAVVGLTIIVTTILQMRRAKTNVEPWKPTTAILDDGLYGISRNPIYLGDGFDLFRRYFSFQLDLVSAVFAACSIDCLLGRDFAGRKISRREIWTKNI